jgi:hypothetical protein
MTALCGGGSSSPIPGFANFLVVSSGFLIQLLESSQYKYLALAAPFVPLATFNLPAFCGTDPPAQPTFTQSEVDALLKLTFGADFTSGLSKLGDLIQNRLWFTFCQCDAGAQPAVPAPQAQPAGSSTLLPTYQGPCSAPATGTDTISATTGTFQLQFQRDWRDYLDPTGFAPLGGTPHPAQLLVDMRNQIFAPTPTSYTWRVRMYSTLGGTTEITLNDFTLTSGVSQVQILSVPANAVGVNIYTSHNVASPTNNPLTHTTLLCVPTTTTPLPCCTPDQVAAGLLQQILLQANLIQRQAVPFGYVASTVHAGLSGAGTIAISGLIGIKVHATATPASLGREGTTPQKIFDMGFLTFGTADGYPSSYRLERTDELLLPARCSAFTELAYDLHPGVTVTITELVREP